MSASFGHQEAKAFMSNFVKLDEVRQGIRNKTPEDAVLAKSETEIRAKWLFSPEAMKNPAEEGKRIAKVLYEYALTAGGDTDFIIDDYFPGYFENGIFMATDMTNFPPQVKSAYIALAVPFYEAAGAVFEELFAVRNVDKEPKIKSHCFGQEEAIDYFKNLEVILPLTIEKRILTPEEQKAMEVVRQTEMSWFKDKDVELHPVREGKRLAELLFKHASAMEVENAFVMESYLPQRLANSGAMLAARGGIMQNCFEIFTTSALKTFKEAKGQKGN